MYYDYADTILMIGNPGVGKSTLLNGLIGKIEFKAGVNYGTGLTCWVDQKWARGTCFIDTPGLSDIEKRTQAALEIEKALKKNGNYRVFFVVTLESGRIRPDDKTTMKLVLEAAKEIKTDKYAIIVNKASNRICQDLQNSTYKYFNTDLPGTTHIFYNPHDPLLFDEDNKLPSLSQEFHNFVKHAPRISVDKEKVDKIQVDLFEKLKQEHAKKLEEVERYWEKRLQEQAQKERFWKTFSTTLVGAEEELSWDCWKKVVRDKSTEPSPGLPLIELAKHENVAALFLTELGLLIQNKFGETFVLILVDVPSYGNAFHAINLETVRPPLKDELYLLISSGMKVLPPA